LDLTRAIKREYIYLTSIARTLWLLRLVKPNSTRSIVDIVEAQARKRPDNIAIYYLDQRMRYAELDQRANRYAHWARHQGITGVVHRLCARVESRSKTSSFEIGFQETFRQLLGSWLGMRSNPAL